MMVPEQDVPFISFALAAADHALAADFDRYPAAGAAERVSAGVNRICQDVVDGVVDRQLPEDAASVADGVTYGRQGDPLMTELEMNLPDA